MQIGEQDLAAFQPFAFGLERLLDLDNELRAIEHRGSISHDLRTRCFICGIFEARAGTGSRFDQHLMASADELPDRRGNDAHAIFVVLDLLGHPDKHDALLSGSFPYHTDRKGGASFDQKTKGAPDDGAPLGFCNARASARYWIGAQLPSSSGAVPSGH